MRLLFRRFNSNRIVFQIAVLVIISLVLSGMINFAITAYQFRLFEVEQRPATVAAEIAAVARLVAAAISDEERDRAILTGRKLGLNVRIVPIGELLSIPEEPSRPRFLKAMIERSVGRSKLTVLTRLQPQGNEGDAVVIKLAGQAAAVFELPPAAEPPSIFRGPVLLMFATTAVFLATFSTYALRWITSPLTSFSKAIEAFGEPFGEDQQLQEKGPYEIARAARALNIMRKRIRKLIDERTYILTAISHDLRTPLTRLLLHAERLTPSPTRERILGDLAKIRDMISDTLTYSTPWNPSEHAERVDLPSLLQTICAEFTDAGHPVNYIGCDHFAYQCQPFGLLRAVTNIVENASRYGTTVNVAFQLQKTGTVEISVSDDGPGIPLLTRDELFEPFFRADASRPSLRRGGFGLGLTIARDIVTRMGGSIQLLDNVPQGLTVCITLPTQTADVESNIGHDAKTRTKYLSRP